MYIDSFCSDLIFYYRGSDTVYTNSCVDNKDTYFEQNYIIDKNEKVEFDALLNKSVMSNLVILKKREYDKDDIGKYTFMYFVPTHNGEEATVIFVMRDIWFTEHFKSIFNRYSGSIEISLRDSKRSILIEDDSFDVNNSNLYSRGFEKFFVKSNTRNIRIIAMLNKGDMFVVLYKVYLTVYIL